MSDPAMNPLTVAANEVKVRMYRQGLGDCFLLAFPGEDKPSYVLIDCGLVTSAPNREKIKQVVADIGLATNHRIDLLIVTHEHWDHVSGFLEAIDEFRRIEIENLWLAWTEDETHDLAQKILTERSQRFADVRAALGRAREQAGMAHIRGLLEFFGDESVLGAAGGRGTVAALKQARALSKTAPYYCYPKEELKVPGAAGVRVYVLGPPLSQEKLEQIDPTAAGHETYTEADGTALDARRSFLMAARYGGTTTSFDTQGDDQDLFDLSFPFDRRYRVSQGDAKSDQFFQQNYGFAEIEAPKPGPDWRRIDDDWLDAAEDLALRLDRLTNNTSLALAFELVNSGKVLLFPADAQVGNWMSWHDYTWTVQGRDRLRDVDAKDLLARTVLYKVGHHGSHNATLRDKGLKMMNHPDLVAMVPVDVKTAHEKKRWKKMPFLPLISDLKKKTRGRILQVDQPLSEQPPDGVSPEVWGKFLEATREEPLYFQHTIVDEPPIPQ